MYPHILHIYGPVWINSYGFMIAVGISAFLFLTVRYRTFDKVITRALFYDVIFWGILSGVIGGRLLFMLEDFYAYDNWMEIFYPWVGGLSMLGSIIAILITVPIFLVRNKIAVLPFLDIVGLHALVIQSFARIGCFLAGCCHGLYTSGNLFIVYTHMDSLAPLNVHLYPTQLSESILCLLGFLLLRFIASRVNKQGQMLALYLMLTSTIRFTVDFWRGDRGLDAFSFINLSFSQSVALLIFITGMSLFICRHFTKDKALL